MSLSLTPRKMPPKLTPNRAFVAKKEAEKKDAQADRDDTSMYNLTTSLVDFLLYVMQDVCPLHDPATEQVESSSSKAPMQKYKMTLRECEEIIYDELQDCATATGYYDEPALLLHKKMWDVMLRCPPHK